MLETCGGGGGSIQGAHKLPLGSDRVGVRGMEGGGGRLWCHPLGIQRCWVCVWRAMAQTLQPHRHPPPSFPSDPEGTLSCPLSTSCHTSPLHLLLPTLCRGAVGEHHHNLPAPRSHPCLLSAAPSTGFAAA